MVCQVAKVSKVFASIGQIFDHGNEVIFRHDGVDIVHLASGRRTPFRRHGNVYVMDAWIRNPNWKDEDEKGENGDQVLGFVRPGVSRYVRQSS